MTNARILIVEDEIIVARDIESRLSALGYLVAGLASDAEQAVRLAEELRPDLVLMDIRLKGGTDGIEAAGQIRARTRLPVVYLTAYADEPTLRRAQITEPLGYVLKPFAERELRTVVEMALYKHAAERRLRQSEEQLADFVENAPVGIHWASADGIILRANRAELEMLGYSAEQYVGRHVRDFYADRPVIDEIRRRLAAGDTVSGLEVRLRHKNGSVRHAVITSNGYREGGRLVHTRCLTTDITDRKKLEEDLQQARKMEAIGQLAGGVAHDFNNLLTVINGYASLLLEAGERDPDWRAHLEEIHKAGERAAELTRQLLAFGRRSMLQPRVFSLNDAVRGLENMLRRLIGEHIALQARLDPALGPVRADPGQIDQVIVNLAVNARDAMPGGGTLTIATAEVTLREKDTADYPEIRPGRYRRLTVADTGTGMSAEVVARIFEPFFTTKEVGKGTGLGLATVYGIVKQSGGHILVESEEGEGTTFTVYLPPADADEAAVPAVAAAVSAPPGRETVLLVEDERSVRSIGSHVLRSCGYTVLEAGDGVEALEVYARHGGPVDLLVTDVIMPRMSGRQLADRLYKERPGLKVLYVSGYTDSTLVRLGVREGAPAVLFKPFKPADLAVKVREVLDER